MVTRIYFWDSASSKSFGHIALELSDGSYVSWWPKEEMKNVAVAIAGTEAKWYDDFPSELKVNGNPSKTFNLFDLNEENIKAYFKKLLEGSKRWDLMKRSCSNVIYNALCEGSEWFKGRAGDTTTPKAVAELAEAYGNDKTDKKIKFSSFCK
jgi:hypothetical protein